MYFYNLNALNFTNDFLRLPLTPRGAKKINLLPNGAGVNKLIFGQIYVFNKIRKMENDKKFLSRAVELAMKSISDGGGPFGAVITLNEKIISEAYNKVVLNNDPTAHAEVLAIRQAASSLNTHNLDKCVLYTSCEPCPMCLGAIYWAGIKKVVFACDRNDAEKAGFSDNFIYEEISIDPENRKISFIRINDDGGREVFKSWDRLTDKIPY